jgi:hypothetical protein
VRVLRIGALAVRARWTEALGAAKTGGGEVNSGEVSGNSLKRRNAPISGVQAQSGRVCVPKVGWWAADSLPPVSMGEAVCANECGTDL